MFQFYPRNIKICSKVCGLQQFPAETALLHKFDQLTPPSTVINRQTLNPTNLCLLPTLALLPAIFSVKYPLLNYITCVMEWKMSIETAQNKAEIPLTPVDESLLFTRRLSRSQFFTVRLTYPSLLETLVGGARSGQQTSCHLCLCHNRKEPLTKRQK